MLQTHCNRIKIEKKKAKESGHMDDCPTPQKRSKLTEREKLT